MQFDWIGNRLDTAFFDEDTVDVFGFETWRSHLDFILANRQLIDCEAAVFLEPDPARQSNAVSRSCRAGIDFILPDVVGGEPEFLLFERDHSAY